MRKFDNKKAGVLTSSDLRTFKGKVIYGMFMAILLAVAVISLIPAIWTISSAFKDTQEIYQASSFFPKGLTFSKAIERIVYAWNKLDFGMSIVNTIVLSLGNLVFSVVLCGLGGYVLSKMNIKGGKLIFTLVVWTMMMPTQIRMVPNYISYLHFPFAANIGIGVNILDTFWPFWLGCGANAYAVLMYKNAFDGISTSYVEAARIDGCSNFGIFFKIMFPLSMPIIIYQSIGALSSAWSDYFGPLLILDTKSVVPLDIFRLKGSFDIKMNVYFMALVIGSIPPFLIFAFFQKKIMGGVNVGGVKG